MNLQARLAHLERLARHRTVTQDLRALSQFAFRPGEKPPDLPDEHPAKPLVEILKAMHRSVAPLGPYGGKNRKKNPCKEGV